MAECDVVGVNELDKPSCKLKLAAGFTWLLMASTRITRGECAPGKLTEDTFEVIKFFLMANPTSEDGVRTCTEGWVGGGDGFTGKILFAWDSKYGETDVLEKLPEIVLLATGIWDDKLVVATEAERWIILSGAKFCRVKGFCDASVNHPLWKIEKMGSNQLMQ